jgi:hypothetical protein
MGWFREEEIAGRMALKGWNVLKQRPMTGDELAIRDEFLKANPDATALALGLSKICSLSVS